MVPTTPSDAGGASPAARATIAPARNARPPSYDFARFEAEWRARWEASGQHQPDLHRAPRPYYNLMMFPYPSAEGLHVGNMYAYVGSDVHGRWKAMQGYDVFEPMGFDAFGIHSENFAIRRGIHPRPLTERNTATFRAQLERIGNRFDWSHTLNSTDPAYYRWTQWIFVQLFKAGLVERKTAPVNWCPTDRTVLADEQVIAGRCERCDSLVERRELRQWFFGITRYAEPLLRNLEWLDWSERVKQAQRAWIGRSEGLRVVLRVRGRQPLEVFTTRPDTLYGATFVAVAPDHPAAATLPTPARQAAVQAYRERARLAPPALATGEPPPPTGIFTGAYAVHPITGARLPIWLADYVLASHGTGAVLGVPAHDARDLALARTAGLPVRPVVRPVVGEPPLGQAFTQPGVLVESGEFSGMPSSEGAEAIIAARITAGDGARAVTYHLRDWLISRQRYWGVPIPIIHCPTHGAVPVPEAQLPVLLPETANFLPTGTGESPLAAIPAFVETTCPICGEAARRETDVCDNFLDSAWYFLRYPSVGDERAPWDPALTSRWLPVSMYIGGAEHSVLHLLYARFITMALHDAGHLPFAEPFLRFRAHGILTRGGVKISKSRGNGVEPDRYIQRYGADAFRCYLLFMGPYEAGGEFQDGGIAGPVRFLERVWRVATAAADAPPAPLTDELRRALHRTIRRVTHDVEALKYNTALAALMSFASLLEAAPAPPREAVRALLLLLAPFAPFITEDLWRRLGEDGSIHTQPWPEATDVALRGGTRTLVVQVDGRFRAALTLPAEATAEAVRAAALAEPAVQRALGARPVRQEVTVPGRLLNFVTGSGADVGSAGTRRT